ncbi:hypothetical protein [Streptomyces sp. NPDC007088]|uniref:hypothetical protein n=1 Tax=Streptomyces sp. NPDC007088 TaxID=3364773 RepID=UPI00368C5A71
MTFPVAVPSGPRSPNAPSAVRGAPPVSLADLTSRTGLSVLEHVEREVTIPVLDALQAQGDLLLVPEALVPGLDVPEEALTEEVPAGGVELLRGTGGGHPHTLVADPGTCRWTVGVHDPEWLALGLIENTAPAYLIHPEHGGTGLAPGRWLVRRQRERDGSARPFTSALTRLIED